MEVRELAAHDVDSGGFEPAMLGLVVGEIDHEGEMVERRVELLDLHRAIEKAEDLRVSRDGFGDLEEHELTELVVEDLEGDDVAVEHLHQRKIVHPKCEFPEELGHIGSMNIAALYDIHANLPALEAVLRDVGAVDLVLVGGDVVWGPWPQETMDVLRSLPSCEFIMGNADRDVFDRVEGNWKATNHWCADRLDVDHHAFLASRPATLSFDDVLYCHGSPRSDEEAITTGTSDEGIREAFAGVAESTVAFGHTHGQFERQVDRWRIVNPGSVGNPFGEPGAYWATFVDGRAELRFSSYDVDAAARAVLDTGWPYATVFARQLTNPAPASAAAEHFN